MTRRRLIVALTHRAVFKLPSVGLELGHLLVQIVTHVLAEVIFRRAVA